MVQKHGVSSLPIILWLVSLDQGHKFGLETPLNLVKEVEKLLAGQYLTRIDIKEGTGDLVLELTDRMQIQAFISSTGYETYEFNYSNERYIGMGAGKIAKFPL